MFYNLVSLLNDKGMTNDELAKVLGIHRNTLAAKLSGNSQFNFDEIDIIMTIFKEYNFAFLFAREPSSRPA